MKLFPVVMGVLFLALCIESMTALDGCAGKVPGNAVWTQTNPTTWDYGFTAGPLLGRVTIIDDSYSGYGCNGQNQTGLATLEAAEAFVQQTCASANQTKK